MPSTIRLQIYKGDISNPLYRSREGDKQLTNSPTSVSLEFANTFVTNASAVFVLTNSAPHACIARSRIGGLSSTRSDGVCTIGNCGKNCVKKMYTAEAQIPSAAD